MEGGRIGSIFLSYSRGDRAFAERIARVLEEAGHRVWWDRHLEGGGEFAAEIEAELDKADVVLVAWSSASVKSRWVRDEAAAGGDTERLVPVSLDGTLPPIGFRQFHTLDLGGWKGGKRDERTSELLHSIERKLGAPSEVRGAPSLSPAKRPLALPAEIWKWTIAGVFAAMIIAAGAVYYWTTRDQRRGPIAKPTIALVSFTAPSTDGELGRLADQARNSISHTLSQTGIPVRLLSSVPQDRSSAGDFLLSGDLTRDADTIVVTVRLEEAAHGVTVLTNRFEAGKDDVRYLGERIGAQMAAFFGGPQLLVLDRRYPMAPELMAELLADTGDPLQKYQTSKRIAAKAPDDPNAQIGVAYFTGFVLSELPRGERQDAVIAARQAADKALALAPDFGDIYGAWCGLHSDVLIAQCEDQLRTGLRIDPDAPYLNSFLAALVRGVGRFADANDLSRLSYTRNPYDDIKIGEMLRTFELTGEGDEAQNLFEQGVRWWPEEKYSFLRNRLFGLMERGDFDGMVKVEEKAGPSVLPPSYPKTREIAEAVRSKSALALRRACAAPGDWPILEFRCMIAFGIVGDQDDAYSIADKWFPQRVGRTAAETERIWLDDPDSPPAEFITAPAAAPLRRDPRFIELAKRTGLLAYWRSGRLPDFCGKSPEPVCKQLLRRD